VGYGAGALAVLDPGSPNRSRYSAEGASRGLPGFSARWACLCEPARARGNCRSSARHPPAGVARGPPRAGPTTTRWPSTRNCTPSCRCSASPRKSFAFR
jgi:hypothetical protein